MKAKLTKDQIFKTFGVIETKVADGNGRTLVVKITSPTPDRSHDIVVPMGMIADNYLKNPVVLYAHDYSDLPIAKCTELKAIDTGVLASVQFPDEGTYPKADQVYNLYKQGILNAWSIGFMPLEFDENDAGGHTFTKWELFEFSAVPVPDNAEALTVMRSKGIDVDLLLEKKEVKEVKKEPTLEITIKIADADVVVKTLDEAKELIEKVVTENTELKAAAETVVKAGRTISGKHEALLNKACEHMGLGAEAMKNGMDCIKEVLASVVENPEEPESGDDNDKGKMFNGMSRTQAKNLIEALKKADQGVGLTLRLLKALKKPAK
jgi:HK97 family phage prohead protease